MNTGKSQLSMSNAAMTKMMLSVMNLSPAGQAPRLSNVWRYGEREMIRRQYHQ